MSTRLWIPSALLLFALAGCGHGGASSAEEAHSGEAEAVVTVQVEPARRETVVETVEGLGRCEALPDHLATLNPAVEGHVHALLVEQGASVEKGQPIVELDNAVAKADLAEKTATRDGLKASLALLNSRPRPEERRANELAVAQAKIAVERAERTAEQLRPLRASRTVSDQQVYEAEKAVDTAKLQLATAEAQLTVQTMGPRPEAVAEAEAKIKTAEGAVEFSKVHLDLHTIRSPITGVLDSLTCHPGQTIAIGAAIGEVVDTRRLFASVWLPTRHASSVKVGQSAEIKLDVASEGEEGVMKGKVAYVGRVADAQTGNLPVHVLVENPKGLLTLGQTVQVTITVSEKPNVLTVPVAAIVDQGEGPVLSVIRGGKTVSLHPEIGSSHAGRVEVSKIELKPGEPVIIEGGYNLPEGTPVKVAEEHKDDEHKDAKHAETKG